MRAVMENFTPYSSLLGGLLIGLSATLLLAFNGRIAGISSITGHLLSPRRGEVWWRLLFLGGLIAGAGLYYVVAGDAPQDRPSYSSDLLIISGLLVGLGTSLGGGCTSGHGVCGLGRLSVRSLAATLTFLVVGIVAAYVTRHLLGVS